VVVHTRHLVVLISGRLLLPQKTGLTSQQQYEDQEKIAGTRGHQLNYNSERSPPVFINLAREREKMASCISLTRNG